MRETFSTWKSFYLDALQELGVNVHDVVHQDLDIACRCPVCGDSRYSKSKKRLHLYQKGEVINVNCFNGDCSVKNMVPWKFFESYAPRTYAKYRNWSKQKFLEEIQRKHSKAPRVDALAGTVDFEEWNEPDNPHYIKFIEFANLFKKSAYAEDFEKIRDFVVSLTEEEKEAFKLWLS